MKKTTALFLSFSFIFIVQVSQAQLKFLGLANPDLKQALEKVITDYSKNFSTLKGEAVNDNPQSIEYASLLEFKTAEKNTITEYPGKQPIYSWQAQMLTAEEFDDAKKKYSSLYKDLKAMSLTLNRDYNYRLDGEYDAPDESKKFASSTFRLMPNASGLPKVKVELSLQYEFPEWKIYVSVYQREREDNERGKIKE